MSLLNPSKLSKCFAIKQEFCLTFYRNIPPLSVLNFFSIRLLEMHPFFCKYYLVQTCQTDLGNWLSPMWFGCQTIGLQQYRQSNGSDQFPYLLQTYLKQKISLPRYSICYFYSVIKGQHFWDLFSVCSQLLEHFFIPPLAGEAKQIKKQEMIQL